MSTNPYYDEIKANADEIVAAVNESNILNTDNELTCKVVENTNERLILIFKLNDDTYSCVRYMEQDAKPNIERRRVSYECGLNSSIGFRTGEFLLHLQILLAIKSKVKEFKLDNFTDDPARAARGIYGLLAVDSRRISVPNVKSGEFVGLGVEKALALSEGQMYLKIIKRTYDACKIKMRSFAEKLANRDLLQKFSYPWALDIKENMEKLLSKVDKIPLKPPVAKTKSSKGGKKKTASRRRKYTLKRCKKNKHTPCTKTRNVL